MFISLSTYYDFFSLSHFLLFGYNDRIINEVVVVGLIPSTRDRMLSSFMQPMKPWETNSCQSPVYCCQILSWCQSKQVTVSKKYKKINRQSYKITTTITIYTYNDQTEQTIDPTSKHPSGGAKLKLNNKKINTPQLNNQTFIQVGAR